MYTGRHASCKVQNTEYIKVTKAQLTNKYAGADFISFEVCRWATVSHRGLRWLAQGPLSWPAPNNHYMYASPGYAPEKAFCPEHLMLSINTGTIVIVELPRNRYINFMLAGRSPPQMLVGAALIVAPAESPLAPAAQLLHRRTRAAHLLQ